LSVKYIVTLKPGFGV